MNADEKTTSFQFCEKERVFKKHIYFLCITNCVFGNNDTTMVLKP